MFSVMLVLVSGRRLSGSHMHSNPAASPPILQEQSIADPVPTAGVIRHAQPDLADAGFTPHQNSTANGMRMLASGFSERWGRDGSRANIIAGVVGLPTPYPKGWEPGFPRRRTAHR